MQAITFKIFWPTYKVGGIKKSPNFNFIFFVGGPFFRVGGSVNQKIKKQPITIANMSENEDTVF